MSVTAGAGSLPMERRRVRARGIIQVLAQRLRVSVADLNELQARLPASNSDRWSDGATRRRSYRRTETDGSSHGCRAWPILGLLVGADARRHATVGGRHTGALGEPCRSPIAPALRLPARTARPGPSGAA